MGKISDSFGNAFRDYIAAGVPASGPHEPVKAEIRALGTLVDTTIGAAAAGVTTLPTTAARDTFYATEANRAKLVYVNNNNGSATDPANGVYEYVGGAARLAQSFYAGVATVVQPLVDDAEDAADRAELAALQAADAVALLRVSSRIEAQRKKLAAIGFPVGIVRLPDYGFTDYENAYNVRFYSDGSLIWPMVKVDASWREEWASGGLTYRDPADASLWRSVLLSRRFDPTRQGAAFVTRYVRYSNGIDSTTGSQGQSADTPWKRLGYAINTALASGQLTRIVVKDNWLGSDSLPPTITITASISIVCDPDNGSGRAWWSNMRETYTQTVFNWQDKGSGIWLCAEPNGTINQAVKATPSMFDLGTLDEDTAPTPMRPLTGTFANEAAILAALAPGQWYNDTTASPPKLYVRRYDGAKPNPGVNWSYVEGAFKQRVNVADGVVAHFSRLAVLSTSSNGDGGPQGFYGVATSVTVPGPRVEKTGQLWLEHPQVYGASGNAILYYDIARGGPDFLLSKHNRDDAFGNHTFYVYSNVNTGDRTLEGRHIHNWCFAALGADHGENGFINQPALGGSSNLVTEHDQCRMTSLNCVGTTFNGALFATVSGAKSWHINAFGSDPTIADTTAVPKSIFWCDGQSAAGVTAQMNVLGGSGQVAPDGKVFAVTTGGAIRVAAFRGPITKKLTSGTITDPAGNPL